MVWQINAVFIYGGMVFIPYGYSVSSKINPHEPNYQRMKATTTFFIPIKITGYASIVAINGMG